MDMKTFLNHDQDDTKLAEYIAEGLNKSKCSPGEEKIECSYCADLPRGEKLQEAKSAAIKESDVCVALVNSESFKSPEQIAKFEKSIRSLKPPVIVLLKGISPEDLKSKKEIVETIFKSIDCLSKSHEDLKPKVDCISNKLQELGIHVFNPFEKKTSPNLRRWKIYFSVILSVSFLVVISFFLFNRVWVDDIVKLDRTPELDSIGGAMRMTTISGTVKSAHIRDNRIVVYAYTNMWYVQPFDTRPLTTINEDGSWETSTHLGSKYLILLVKPDYVTTKPDKADPKDDDNVISSLTFPKE